MYHCYVISFPERTQDDMIVFTIFICSDTVQVRTITNSIVSFQSGSVLFSHATFSAIVKIKTTVAVNKGSEAMFDII